MKVLMSAYACEPGKGSEPGVGWNWATTMAQHVEVTVATRKNNRGPIEEYWQNCVGSEKQPAFIYYDLPRLFVYLKKVGIIPVKIYYLLWQIGLAWYMRKKRSRFDIIHHVTFNIFTCPGFWWGGKEKVVLGPLGGGICVADEYMELFGKAARTQKVRNFFTHRWRLIPTIVKSLDRADTILCANIDTYKLLEPAFPHKVSLHLETGIDPVLIETTKSPTKQGSLTEFIIVGGIEARKGWRLAIEAMNQVVHNHDTRDIQLSFVGDGPDYKDAQDLVKNLGLTNYVKFHGKMTHEKTKELIQNADALLFPSVRDTSGNVVLEAMAMSKPVICINHQGVAEMTSNDCAIRIEPTRVHKTVVDIAESMMKLALDPDLREKLGACGSLRINDRFTWSSKGKFMLETYQG